MLRAKINVSMKWLPIILVLSLVSCSSPITPDSTPTNTSASTPSLLLGERALTVDCGNLDLLEVTTVDEEKRSVNISVGGLLLRAINVPRQIESGISGFSLDWAKKTQEGFEISFEYGSRYYFSKRLIFECRKDDFYLTKIHVESFDKHNPSKWTKKTVVVKPPVPLGEFDLMKYTDD